MEGNGSSEGFRRTYAAVMRQLTGMPSALYEVGLYLPARADKEPEMLPRTWDAATLVRSIPWLRWQNSRGRNIYIRPAGEHQFSLVDDLTAENLDRLGREGFLPSVVVETSLGNFQAWLNHGEVLPKDVSTAAGRALALKFGADQGSADWRHFGRVAGFTNRKPNRRTANGLYPFVHLIEARDLVYPVAKEFLRTIGDQIAREAEEKHRISEWWPVEASPRRASLRIDDFRANARYAGDGNRIDLAYAVYALSHGASEDEIRSAIASRDLTKKGSPTRQQQYVERTIEKARSIAGLSTSAGSRRMFKQVIER